MRNKGIAFGRLSGESDIIVLVCLLGLIAVLLLYRPLVRKGMGSGVALGLVVGGSLGNLVDRIFRAEEGVVDFLDFHIWPVFNLADVAITVGFVILIIMSLKGERGPRG